MRRCNAPPPDSSSSQSNLSKLLSDHKERDGNENKDVDRKCECNEPKIGIMLSSVSSSSSLEIPPPPTRPSSPQPQPPQPESRSNSSITAFHPHKMVRTDDATAAVAATNKKISKRSSPKKIPSCQSEYSPSPGGQDENYYDTCTNRMKENIQKKHSSEQEVKKQQQQHGSFPSTTMPTRASSLEHQHYPQKVIANEAAAARGNNCVNNHRDSNVQGDANLSTSDDEPEKDQENMVPSPFLEDNENCNEGTQHGTVFDMEP